MLLKLLYNNYHDVVKSKRFSIANFLLLVYHSGKSNSEMQREILNSYLECLKVDKRESAAYLEKYNVDRMFMDLRSIEITQRTFLIVLCHNMLNAGRKPSEEELQFVSTAFNKIGVGEEEYEKNVLMTTLMRVTSKLK